jgi:ABC-type lipoprotein export system ATPase subunit
MVLRVEEVTHRLGRATVLSSVAFSVDGPALVALAGRSGSGKSTLCHLIAGLGSPSAGRVLLDGRPAAEVDDWAVVSLLPQRLALVEELSIAENVLFPALLRGRPAEVPAGLGLEEVAGRLAGQASLGEQQRAALARALVLAPRVAVLDEPTGHQDDVHVDQVLATLLTARDAGTCVLVATHDDRVLDAADVIIRMERGRLVSG